MKSTRESFVRRTLVAVFALSLLNAACGEDDEAGVGGSGGSGATSAGHDGGSDVGGAGGTGAGTGGSDGGTNPACDALAEGVNENFMVDGEPRMFILNLPTGVETGGPWAVVFNWHGLGDTAERMSALVSSHVDNPALPFIAVTPEDTNHLVMSVSVDWDVFQVTQDNKEARLFDEVLACLDQRFGVDPNHIHSMGFSLGGILTDMLGTIRGEQLASLATYSGGYWSNPDNLDATISMLVSWPEYTTANQYAQLFIHGGTSDSRSLGIYTIQFDQYAINDAAFLNDHGHDAVLCDHGGGHTVPSDMRADKLIEFFADHPLGTTDSPYATGGLPADFPAYCTFHGG